MTKQKRNLKGQFNKGRTAWNKGKKMPKITGKNNYQWKGLNPGYFTLHSWLNKNYGKANKCENPNCKFKNPKRYEWSLIKGKGYQRQRENFFMLCCSCHRKYDIDDNWRKENSKAHKGNYPVNTKYYTLNGETLSLREWSKKLNIKHSTLGARINQSKWPLHIALSSNKYINQSDSPINN